MKTNNHGVGLVEVAIGIVILGLIAVGLSLSSSSIRQASVGLSIKDACYQAARNVASNIKAYENDLTVRNWIPGVRNGNNEIPQKNNRDPLCSTTRAKGVCEEIELLSGTGTGAGAKDFYNFLNRRNAATWGYLIYRLAKRGIAPFTPSPDPVAKNTNACTVYLADFDPLYLPSPIAPNTLFQGFDGVVTLRLTQTNTRNLAECNRESAEPGNSTFFQITAGVYLKNPGEPNWQASCAAQTSVGYRPDTEKASLTLKFKNAAGEDLNPARLSTDPATPYNLCEDFNGEPYDMTTWPKSRGLMADLTASEPGSYFRCDVSLSNNPDNSGLRKCTAAKVRLTDVSGNSVFDGDFDWLNDTALYNQRPQARIQWGGMPLPTPALRAPLPYSTPPAAQPVLSAAFEVIDVGRNQTRVPANGKFYFTLKADCPPSVTVCPNAPIQNDGCGGQCPQGTMTGINTPPICPDPRLFCSYHRPCDTCELTSCPAGTRGNPQRIGPKNPANYLDVNGYDCPPADTYYPCENRYDYCGQLCPRGTKNPDAGLQRDQFCSGTTIKNLCGEDRNGTSPIDCATSTPPPETQPDNCPPPDTYCSDAPAATGPGTVLTRWDGQRCAPGTFDTTASGTCPPIGDYCQGAGQSVRNSCGQNCPAGLPSPSLRTAGYCCLGCNSAGNPPSFKRATSCDTYNTDSGGTGSCSFVNNCYQYNPP